MDTNAILGCKRTPGVILGCSLGVCSAHLGGVRAAASAHGALPGHLPHSQQETGVILLALHKWLDDASLGSTSSQPAARRAWSPSGVAVPRTQRQRELQLPPKEDVLGEPSRDRGTSPVPAGLGDTVLLQ